MKTAILLIAIIWTIIPISECSQTDDSLAPPYKIHFTVEYSKAPLTYGGETNEMAQRHGFDYDKHLKLAYAKNQDSLLKLISSELYCNYDGVGAEGMVSDIQILLAAWGDWDFSSAIKTIGDPERGFLRNVFSGQQGFSLLFPRTASSIKLPTEQGDRTDFKSSSRSKWTNKNQKCHPIILNF